MAGSHRFHCGWQGTDFIFGNINLVGVRGHGECRNPVGSRGTDKNLVGVEKVQETGALRVNRVSRRRDGLTGRGRVENDENVLIGPQASGVCEKASSGSVSPLADMIPLGKRGIKFPELI